VHNKEKDCTASGRLVWNGATFGKLVWDNRDAPVLFWIMGKGYCVLLHKRGVYVCELREYKMSVSTHVYKQGFFYVLSVLLSLSCNLLFALSILRINTLLHLCSSSSSVFAHSSFRPFLCFRCSLVYRSAVSSAYSVRSFSVRPPLSPALARLAFARSFVLGACSISVRLFNYSRRPLVPSCARLCLRHSLV